jgi:hypothetical protein
MKTMIPTYTKGFPWKKWPKLAGFFIKKLIPERQIFMRSSNR